MTIALTDLAMLLFSERLWKELELGARGAIECSEPSGLFRGSLELCGSLEDKNVENDTDKRGLAWEISEGSKDSITTIYVIFWVKNLCLWSAGAKELVVMNRRQKWNFCSWHYWFWSSVVETLVVMKKRSSLLRQNLLGNVSSGSTQRSSGTEAAKAVPHPCSQIWKCVRVS